MRGEWHLKYVLDLRYLVVIKLPKMTPWLRNMSDLAFDMKCVL